MLCLVKDRIEQLEKSNADEESNFVSIREAVAVSDYRNQRQLMMNILKRDTKNTGFAVLCVKQ